MSRTVLFILLVALGAAEISAQVVPQTPAYNPQNFYELLLSNPQYFLINIQNLFFALGNSDKLRIGGRTYQDYVDLVDELLVNSFCYYFGCGVYETDDLNSLITFWCRNGSTPLTQVFPTFESVQQVLGNNTRTLFAIHGWTDSRLVWYMKLLETFFLQKEPTSNFCIVDWSPLSKTSIFDIAEPECFRVANVTAEFINFLYRNIQQDPLNVILIGHSLGAQISGLIGNFLQKVYNLLIGIILAADQTGPGWQYRWNTDDEKLTAKSAKYVQAVICNVGVLGAPEYQQLGYQRFVCNGGGPQQPGCTAIDIGICPHYRCIEYLIYSILYNFLGIRCDSPILLLSGLCSNGAIDKLGLYGKKQPGGLFQVYTNWSAPFYLDEEVNGDGSYNLFKYLRNAVWISSTSNVGTNND